MIDVGPDTQMILDGLVREGHIELTPEGNYFNVKSDKYAFLKKLDPLGPYPYFCIYLSDQPVRLSNADMEWARSVAERVL